MAHKALKLEVPSNGSTRRLCVKTGHRRPELRRPYKVDDSRLPVGDHIDQSETDIVVKDFFGESNRVPDVIRYRICDDRSIIPISCCVAEDRTCVPHDVRYRICDTMRHCNHPERANCHCDIYGPELEQLLGQLPGRNIVLLLESPHKDEYEYNDDRIGRRKAPASGSSGRNINRYLHNVLSHINEDSIVPHSHVIISNPVQFQASLHAIHRLSIKGWRKTLRDNVWRTLWDEPMIKQGFRHRLLTYRPSLIINACTASLKCLVSGELPNLPRCEVGHPAYWHFPNNRVPDCIYPPANQNADNPQQ